MYFSPEKLLEGIMVHVGLKMTEELSTDTIKSFIDSAIEFHNQKASHKELQKAQREVDKVNRKYRALANKMIKERHRMLRLCNLAKACVTGNHSLTDALAALHARVHNDGQLKELTLADFGITSDQITDDEPTDDGDDEDTE
jgi:membrane-associated HD superfamily phosphohydrolase